MSFNLYAAKLNTPPYSWGSDKQYKSLNVYFTLAFFFILNYQTYGYGIHYPMWTWPNTSAEMSGIIFALCF